LSWPQESKTILIDFEFYILFEEYAETGENEAAQADT